VKFRSSYPELFPHVFCFGGEKIRFDASLVICTSSTIIPPVMFINRIYENQNKISLECDGRGM